MLTAHISWSYFDCFFSRAPWRSFAKENPLFIIKAATFEGSFIPGDQIDRLALLPTFEEALGRLMATLREASAGKQVRTLAALRDKLQEVA